MRHPTGRAKATNKKIEGPVWREVKTADGIGIQGGFSTPPVFVPVVRHEGQAFVKLNKSTGWLCHIAAGQAGGLAPLARTTLLETLRDEARKAGGNEDTQESGEVKDAMAGFGLDEDDLMQPIALAGALKARRRCPTVQVAITVPNIPEPIVCLSGPPLGSTGKAVWVHVESLRSVVQILGDQVGKRGVDYCPPETTLRKPWWSSSDRTWVCRAKTPAGDIIRKRLSVLHVLSDEVTGTRRPLSKGAFSRLKAKKLQELEEWQRAVEAGEVEE